VIPEEIIQGHIDFVWIHGQWKNFRLRVPPEARMYSVFRGSLPGRRMVKPTGFDGFLLGEAVKEGARIQYGEVQAIAYGASGMPRLSVKGPSGTIAPLDASRVRPCHQPIYIRCQRVAYVRVPPYAGSELSTR
jgi:hypothetical protein